MYKIHVMPFLNELPIFDGVCTKNIAKDIIFNVVWNKWVRGMRHMSNLSNSLLPMSSGPNLLTSYYRRRRQYFSFITELTMSVDFSSDI